MWHLYLNQYEVRNLSDRAITDWKHFFFYLNDSGLIVIKPLRRRVYIELVKSLPTPFYRAINKQLRWLSLFSGVRMMDEKVFFTKKIKFHDVMVTNMSNLLQNLLHFLLHLKPGSNRLDNFLWLSRQTAIIVSFWSDKQFVRPEGHARCFFPEPPKVLKGIFCVYDLKD